VFIVTVWFTHVSFAAPLWILVFALLGAGMMGALGLIAGLWAEKFDQMAAFQNFVIMPMTFLSGVFYSIHSLPPFWQQRQPPQPVLLHDRRLPLRLLRRQRRLALAQPGDRRQRDAGGRRHRRAPAAHRLQDPQLNRRIPSMTSDELRSIIAAGLACDHLEVDGDGRHWSAVIVSAEFAGLRPIQRHQRVYATLGARMHTDEVHALSMKTFTPAEWAAQPTDADGQATDSRRPAASGEVRISGAKNAALPELCAALLTAEPVTLKNIPRLQDVATMLKLIRNMGATAEFSPDGTVVIDSKQAALPEAPYEMVKTMRASVLALGPLLARFGEATVSLPGGCAIGSRPVDQHIKGLQKMGAEIVVEHGYMIAKLPKGWTRLKGAHITTDMVTVTGTENFMMAPRWPKARRCWRTRRWSRRSPTWAHADRHGREGRRPRHQPHPHPGRRACTAPPRVVADRIECRHLPVRRAATGGDVVLRDGAPEHLDVVIDKLRRGRRRGGRRSTAASACAQGKAG
jgi:acid stress-induced BolA-like protein IbaG/YrbA